MMNIINIFRFIKELIKVMKILSSYNPWTIAEYFREKGAHIGENCYIRTRSLGPEPYLVTLGNHVFIAEGVSFNTHDGGVWIMKDEIPNIELYGSIVIEDNCIIGTNSVLLPNIRIGKNSIIGAGSVVVSDIPPDSIAIGVPARVFSSSAKYRDKCIEKWQKQGLTATPVFDEDKKSGFFWASGKEKKRRQIIKDNIINIYADYFSK